MKGGGRFWDGYDFIGRFFWEERDRKVAGARYRAQANRTIPLPEWF